MKAIKESLTDRVALVTGAGSGIGKNAAKLLAYANAKVALLGHTKDEIEATAHELTSNGHEALSLIADPADPVAMGKAVAKIKSTWGRLDIVVAKAGVSGTWAPIEEIKVEEWDEALSNNLRGTFLTLKYSVPLLKAQGGSVIIIASVSGNRVFSNTGTTAYACSKAAQVAMAKMLAVELGPSKVRVNVICPGKAPGTSGEVAELVWFLASDYSDHISGTEVYIDGAQSLLQG